MDRGSTDADLTPAQRLALWADRLRDLSATGLRFSSTIYDRERYEAIQGLALEMLAFATAQPLARLEPLREPLFTRPTPLVAGTAAIVDDRGRILLMRRADNRLWSMPGGAMEVGETPAAAVVREALEETGVRCAVVALVGVYDSRRWDAGAGQHIYKFTFLCRPLAGESTREAPSHAVETLETGWFAEDALPADLSPGHDRRIRDSFRVWRGEHLVHFDP